MNEGWTGDEYLILFDEHEQAQITHAYNLEKYLPGYRVYAIIGWDDFLVTDQAGGHWRVPTVPLVQKYLEQHRQEYEPNQLKPDDRYAGKIKWYIQPIVFGGDPASKENMTWICINKHQQFVIWWNEKYRELGGAHSVRGNSGDSI